jgi:hypothetical protein
MCDACVNKAREFERSLTDEQREGLKAHDLAARDEINQQSYDLGRDEAISDDNAIYESALAKLDEIQAVWQRTKKHIGEAGAELVDEIDALFEAFPRDLRDV